MALRGAHEARVQRIERTEAEPHHLGAELLNRLTRGRRFHGRRQRLAERDGDGIGQPLGQLPEEAALAEAEDAAPQAIEMDRNHRHVEAVDDALEAAFEGEQAAGAADRAFREDADDVAVLQLFACALERFDHFLPIAAGDGDRFHQAHQRVEHRHLVIRPVDHEPDESLHAGADQQAVDVRHVIAHEQRRAAERHVFLADDADAVERVGEHPQREPDQEVGQEEAGRRCSRTA